SESENANDPEAETSRRSNSRYWQGPETKPNWLPTDAQPGSQGSEESPAARVPRPDVRSSHHRCPSQATRQSRCTSWLPLYVHPALFVYTTLSIPTHEHVSLRIPLHRPLVTYTHTRSFS